MLAAHSGIRFLILLVGVIVIAYSAFGLFAQKDYSPTMPKLGSAFAGLIHLQILLGLAVLFSGTFTPALIGHFFMMGAAAAVAQLTSSVMRRRENKTSKSYAPHLVGTILALALIAGGIMAIGRGIFQSTI